MSIGCGGWATRHGVSAGRERGWYHRARSGPAPTLDPRARQTWGRDRDPWWPGRRRPVGDRDPGLVEVEPDDRLPGRARVGDDRRHDRRPADRPGHRHPDRGPTGNPAPRPARRPLLLGRPVLHVQGADHRQGLDRGADRRDGGRGRGADRRSAGGRADARRGAPAGGHRRRRRPVQHRTGPPRCPGRRHRARGGRPRRPGPRRCPRPRRGPRGARRRRRRADPQDRPVLRGGRLDLRRRPRGGRQVRRPSSRRSGSPSARGSSAWRSSRCRSSCSDGWCSPARPCRSW